MESNSQAVLSDKAIRRRERKKLKAQNAQEEQASRALVPRNERQALLLSLLNQRPVVFAIGPAGSGKTYLAARHAMRALKDKRIDKVYVTRPTAAPVRHKLGFQPGNGNAKMKPWLIPIFDGFKAEIPSAMVEKMMQTGQIEIVPFEFMRGRTFHDSVVICDEAQNCTVADLELLITRIGEGCTMVIAGDPDQDADIPDSGLDVVSRMIEQYELSAGLVRFTVKDVVRSPAAREWVRAFKMAKGRLAAGE